jgi:GT2 family glycosyltransferase
MNKPLITLVTGTYNRLESLQRMLESYWQSIPVGVSADVVIVDGGSTDGTLDWLRNQDNVTLIEHGELLGAIKAFTEGAYAATGKYVLLANDDVEFIDRAAIMKAVIHLEETLTAGAVAFADNRPQSYKKKPYETDYMQAANRHPQFVVYAQVGLAGSEVGRGAGTDGAVPRRHEGAL